MNELLINVKSLKNKTYQRIMLRLIDVYEQEFSCNEGSLTFNDLIIMYSLFYFLETGDK